MVGGVAVLDYDKDGRPDLFFTNGAAQPSLEKSDASYFNRLIVIAATGPSKMSLPRPGLRAQDTASAPPRPILITTDSPTSLSPE